MLPVEALAARIKLESSNLFFWELIKWLVSTQHILSATKEVWQHFALWTLVNSSNQELLKGMIKWSRTIFADQESWSRSQTPLRAICKRPTSPRPPGGRVGGGDWILIYVQQPIHKRLYHTIRTTVGFLTCCVSPTRAGDLAAGRKSDGNLATKDVIVCTKDLNCDPNCDPRCLQRVKLMLEAKLTLCCWCSSIWVSTIELEMDSGTHTQHLLGLKGEFVVLTSCLG